MPPRTSSSSSGRPEAAVRAHFGLSQQQLAAWLGVTVGFVGALDTGRAALPAARVPRLLVLARLLPPPLGTGPPAPPPAEVPPIMAAPLPLPPLATDPLGVPDPVPLRAAARAARLAALTAERKLLHLHARAAALALRRRGLAQLRAAPPPPEAAEATRWATWLADIAAELLAADPHPARTAAQCQLLAVRAATRATEAATLEALAAAAENAMAPLAR